MQTVLTKVDRQVSQFKGSMLKGKVGGGGGEVITQRLVHDEGDASTAVMGQPLKHIKQFDLCRFESKN